MVPIPCHNRVLVDKHQRCACWYAKCDSSEEAAGALIVKVTHEVLLIAQNITG